MYAEEFNKELDVPVYFRENSLIVTDWEAGSRYDIGFSIRIDTLKKSVRELLEWCDRLENNININK